MRIVIVLLALCCHWATAQKSTSVWCFGDSAGINFSSGIPVLFNSSMDGRGNCSSIADTAGNLLFYCNTNYISDTKVWTKLHTPMANSNTMVGDGFYQGQIIVPMPGDSNKYYIFSEYAADGLYYHIVDLSMNGGLGQVIQKNVPITHHRTADCVNAIKHGNGRDWWIITKNTNANPITHYNRFITYLLTPNGITDSLIQDFNDATDGDLQYLFFKSPDSTKFMLINPVGYMREFNFDRCTGMIDTVRTIFPEQTSNYNRGFFLGAYSPNGNIFYVSRNSYGGNMGTKNYLLQYDLTAADIPASCDTLDSVYTFPPVDNGALKLALDGKIYYSSKYRSAGVIDYPYADSMRNNINEYLGVINNPDVVGNGCNFAPFSFYLGGKRTYYGLPNNPNYELGRLVGSPCDTITVITEIDANAKSPLLHLAPNPVESTLYFNAEKVKGKTAVISIRNSFGQTVYEKPTEVFSGGFVTQTINVSEFTNGVYLITLYTNMEISSTRFVKE